MNFRDSYLIKIRPDIISNTGNLQTLDEEFFQNKTLRPIIKLQEELLISVFRHYIQKHKNIFYNLSPEKQLDYIENAIHKDMKFRNSLKGIIIGQFTLEEHKKYMQNSSSLNKRMMHLIKESIKNNSMLLEPKPINVSSI